MLNVQIQLAKMPVESLGQLHPRIEGSGALRWIMHRRYLLKACEWMAFSTSNKSWMPQIFAYASNTAENELPGGSVSCLISCDASLSTSSTP